MTTEQICTIDPGSKNFSFLIEEFDIGSIKKLKCPPKNKRFLKVKESDKKQKDKEPSPEYIDFLDQFWHCGKTIFCKNSDITNGVKGKGRTELTQQDLVRLKNLLDEHQCYFDMCSTIVIEKQMSFGKMKTNQVAIDIEKFVYSYFVIKYEGTKKIVVYPAYNKTQILGCPCGIGKPLRKKWAIEKASEIWTIRGDIEMVEKLESMTKMDDISDSLCIALSWAVLEYF
jgi:hypothetical protein